MVIEPTPNMEIRPSSWVNPAGIVQCPLQTSWNYSLSASQMNLICLLDQLCEIFSVEPPVFSKMTPSHDPNTSSTNPSFNPHNYSIPTVRPNQTNVSSNMQPPDNFYHMSQNCFPLQSSPGPNYMNNFNTLPNSYSINPNINSRPLSPPIPNKPLLDTTMGPYSSMNQTHNLHNVPGHPHLHPPPPIPHSTKSSIQSAQSAPSSTNNLISNPKLEESSTQDGIKDATLLSLRSAITDKIQSNVEIVSKQLQKEISDLIAKKQLLVDHSVEVKKYIENAEKNEVNSAFF